MADRAAKGSATASPGEPYLQGQTATEGELNQGMWELLTEETKAGLDLQPRPRLPALASAIRIGPLRTLYLPI